MVNVFIQIKITNTLDMEENITSLNLNTDIYKTNPLTLFELKHFTKNINYDLIFKKFTII